LGGAAGFVVVVSTAGVGAGGWIAIRLMTDATSGFVKSFVRVALALLVSELALLKCTPTGLDALKAKPKRTLAPSRLSNCQRIRRPIELPKLPVEDGDRDWLEWGADRDASTGDLRCL